MNTQAGFFLEFYTQTTLRSESLVSIKQITSKIILSQHTGLVVQKVDSTIVYPLNEYISLPGIMQFFA